MLNLIRANFSRLIRNKLFYLIITGTVIYSFFEYNRNLNIVYGIPETGYLNYFMATMPAFFIVFGMFIMLFVGADYSNGIIKNKLIGGIKRSSIFASNLISSFAIALVISLIYMGITSLGFNGYPTVENDVSFILLRVVMVTLSCLVYASIFNVIATNSSNQAVNIVLVIVVFVLIVYISGFTTGKLYQIEYLVSVEMNELGEFVETIGDKNPNFLEDGFIRDFLTLIHRSNPYSTWADSGMIQRFETFTQFDKLLMIISPIFNIVWINLVGFFIFKKKEIK